MGKGARVAASLLLAAVGGFLVAASSQAAHAQVPTVAGDPLEYLDASRQADELLAARNYAGAAATLTTIAEAGSPDANVWARLGIARYRAADYKRAIGAFERALALGGAFEQHSSAYVARAHAQLGQVPEAVAWIERTLVRERFEDRDAFIADSAFDRIRADPRFVAATRKSAEPCAPGAAGWRTDLDYLLSEVRRLNIRYSREPFPKEFLGSAEDLRRRFPTLSDAQAAVEMQRLLAMLGQTHNGLWLAANTGRVQFRRLPVTFWLFPEGLFIIDAEPLHEDLIGSRVVAFDDATAERALGSVSEVVNHENSTELLWLGLPALSMPEVLHALGVTKVPGQVRLTVQDGQRGQRSVILAGGPMTPRRKLVASRIGRAAPPLYLRDVGNAYWFQRIPEANAIYIQFNQVRHKSDETLEQFSDRLRTLLASEPGVRNLVIDLRHNNGGNNYHYPRLLRTLVAFDDRPRTRLYALIGRYTYSAASNFLVDLDRLTDVISVGEPTGGKPNTFGDESPTRLPCSGLSGGLSSVYWQLSSPRDERAWIAPDIPVALDAADYFGNRDRALETILRDIARGK